jgi:hypothetical protein
MPAALTVVLPVVARRAPLLWGLIHALFVVVQMAAGGGDVTPAPSAAAILLTGALGLIDTQVRGEGLMWANLGVASAVLLATFLACATVAESLLHVVLRA